MRQSDFAQFLADADNVLEAQRQITGQDRVASLSHREIAAAKSRSEAAMKHIIWMREQISGRPILVRWARAIARAPGGSGDLRGSPRLDLSGFSGRVFYAGLSPDEWQAPGLYIAFHGDERDYAFLVRGSQFDID